MNPPAATPDDSRVAGRQVVLSKLRVENSESKLTNGHLLDSLKLEGKEVMISQVGFCHASLVVCFADERVTADRLKIRAAKVHSGNA